MKEVKCFSTVRLKDGRIGAVVDVYHEPVLGYGIDFYVDYPNGPCPDPWFQAVRAEEIEEVLWEPED